MIEVRVAVSFELVRVIITNPVANYQNHQTHHHHYYQNSSLDYLFQY